MCIWMCVGIWLIWFSFNTYNKKKKRKFHFCFRCRMYICYVLFTCFLFLMFSFNGWKKEKKKNERKREIMLSWPNQTHYIVQKKGASYKLKWLNRKLQRQSFLIASIFNDYRYVVARQLGWKFMKIFFCRLLSALEIFVESPSLLS